MYLEEKFTKGKKKRKETINLDAWIQLKFHLTCNKKKVFIPSWLDFRVQYELIVLYISPLLNDVLEVISFLASVKSFSVTHVHICTRPLRYSPPVSLENHKEAYAA